MQKKLYVSHPVQLLDFLYQKQSVNLSLEKDWLKGQRLQIYLPQIIFSSSVWA